MDLIFQINYRTEYGQTLCVIESEPSTFGWTEQDPLCLDCHGQDFWTAQVKVPARKGCLTYRYAIRLTNNIYVYEGGSARTISYKSTDKRVIVRDFWQVENEEQVFYSTAFQQALFRRCTSNLPSQISKKSNIRFQVDIPQVLPSQGVAVMGNIPQLGNWDERRKLKLNDTTFPIWNGHIQVSDVHVIEYKYCIYDLQTDQVLDLEWGENRQIWGIQSDAVILQNDRDFRRTQPRFKGSGISIPIFSLRTEQGFGIGEFLDLKLLADWAAQTGQKMIQTLPINDTTLTHTNQDSYPYNAVSVFALHPIYINIEHMGDLTPAQHKRYLATKARLNTKPIADYQCVYDEKMKYFKALYKMYGESVLASEDFHRFWTKNQFWLEPYAKFMHQRDKLPEPLYYYLQYHADKQLGEAVAYVHSLRIAIKGDIPIGISPDSVDANVFPELFHLDASAGAPPDAFSVRGQNWGFPTYNWDEMAHDHYAWWRQRFIKMQDYFDAYRIDHILGFFRIWQMRKTDVWGLCGHFVPALPYTLNDLKEKGIKLDWDRMVRPYIRSSFVEEIFTDTTQYVIRTFLDTKDDYVYFFREAFDTQVKIQQYFDENHLTDERSLRIRDGLLYLHCEVLFVQDQDNPELLHPRISVYQSHSYGELYNDQQMAIMAVYNDYFYQRHNDFWYQSGMKKLPTLIHATPMLCCGEDLGMVPYCVPRAMADLKILSLEIQRMPKHPRMVFAHPADAPYLSVCTTGTHDTSPIREWWEEDTRLTQQFYNEQMGYTGKAPEQMSDEIAYFILNQHMYSPAIWVILPLQDWLAIDNDMRAPNPKSERINVPDDPHHFWCYRMHMSLEQLIQCDALNTKINQLTHIRS